MGNWFFVDAFPLDFDSLKFDTCSLLLVFALTMLTLILVRLQQGRVTGRFRCLPPGPRGFPIFGHLPLLGTNVPQTLDAMSMKHGNVFTIRMGSRPVVVVSGYDAILNVIIRKGTDFAGRPDFMSWKYIGDGQTLLFTSCSPSWALHKKLALKAVHLYLKDPGNALQRQISTEAKLFVSRILEDSQDGVNPARAVEISAAAVMHSVCFSGAGPPAQQEDYLKWLQDLYMFQQVVGNPADVMPWLTSLVSRTAVIKRYAEGQKLNVSFVMESYKKHMETFDSMYIRDVTDALIKVLDDCDDSILNDVQLPVERVIHTTINILGAGLSTIGATLSWAILYVTKFPTVQQRVREEVDDVIGENGLPENWDPENFPYTMATLLETIRFSNLNPFLLPHATIRDTTLNGYSIDKGTMVFCNMYSVSKDSNRWRDTHNFNPANFLDSTGEKVDPPKRAQLLAFGAGRRRCLGERIAKMELLIMFSTLLHSCLLVPSPDSPLDLDPEYAFSLVPKPYKVIIRPRKGLQI